MGFSFRFFPVVSYQLQFRISVPSPAVSGASPLSLPFGIPPQSLPADDVVWCFLQDVTNPAPFSSQNLFTYRLFPSLPKLAMRRKLKTSVHLRLHLARPCVHLRWLVLTLVESNLHASRGRNFFTVWPTNLSQRKLNVVFAILIITVNYHLDTS